MTYFIAILVLTALVALASLASQYQLLLAEKTQLKLLRSKLKGVSKGQDPEAVGKALLDGPPSCRVDWRVKHLVDARLRGGALDSSMLSQLDHERCQANLRLPRAAVNLLVLMGLCGAVFGVYQVFGQLNFENIAPDKMLQMVVQQSRQGLIASFSGMVSSAFLLLMTNLMAAQQEHWLIDLEEVSAVQICPLLSLTSDGESLGLAAESFREAARLLTEVSDQLTQKTQVVAESINDFYCVVQNFREGAGEPRTAGDQIKTAHQDVLGSLRQFGENAQKIQASLDQSREVSEKILAGMTTSQKDVQQLVREDQESRRAMEERHQRSMTSLRELREPLQKLADAPAPQIDTSNLEKLLREGAEQTRSLLEKQQQELNLLGEVKAALEKLASAPPPIIDTQGIEKAIHAQQHLGVLSTIDESLKKLASAAPASLDISALEKALQSGLAAKTQEAGSGGGSESVTRALEEGFRKIRPPAQSEMPLEQPAWIGQLVEAVQGQRNRQAALDNLLIGLCSVIPFSCLIGLLLLRDRPLMFPWILGVTGIATLAVVLVTLVKITR